MSNPKDCRATNLSMRSKNDYLLEVVHVSEISSNPKFPPVDSRKKGQVLDSRTSIPVNSKV